MRSDAGTCVLNEQHDCRDTLTKLRPNLDEAKLPLLIFVNKGIEIGTQALTLEIIADTCGPQIAQAATFIVSTPSISTDGMLYLISCLVGSIIRDRKYVHVHVRSVRPWYYY